MSTKRNSTAEKTLGPVLKTLDAMDFAMHCFEISRAEKEVGRKGIPVCAWGPAGIGKTELPNQLVKDNPVFFGGVIGGKGKIKYVPLGQIEEKAELQGLPDIKTLVRELNPNEDRSKVIGSIEKRTYKEVAVDADGAIILDGKGMPVFVDVEKEVVINITTVYAPPSWVPQEHVDGKYGLLVIDDFNRADARIINSVMQLLQDGELLGWALPIGWEIYLTANPDNGKYQVTSLDGAQMTRMVNFQQEFDVKSWAENWAMPTGLHSLAINFGLTHPEMMTAGERTNPRSFDKFFRLAAKYFDKVDAHHKDITIIGNTNLDATAVAGFIAFLTDGFGKLPEPQEILEGKVSLKDLKERISKGGHVRIDVLTALSTRVMATIKRDGIKPEWNEGLKTWLKDPMIPKEVRFTDTREAINIDFSIVDEELAELIFGKI